MKESTEAFIVMKDGDLTIMQLLDLIFNVIILYCRLLITIFLQDLKKITLYTIHIFYFIKSLQNSFFHKCKNISRYAKLLKVLVLFLVALSFSSIHPCLVFYRLLDTGVKI